jgi:hypothetical protein
MHCFLAEGSISITLPIDFMIAGKEIISIVWGSRFVAVFLPDAGAPTFDVRGRRSGEGNPQAQLVGGPSRRNCWAAQNS